MSTCAMRRWIRNGCADVMTLRELWQNTVANLRTLLGALNPTPRTPPPRPMRQPRALPGPVTPAWSAWSQPPSTSRPTVQKEVWEEAQWRATTWVDAAAPDLPKGVPLLDDSIDVVPDVVVGEESSMDEPLLEPSLEDNSAQDRAQAHAQEHTDAEEYAAISDAGDAGNQPAHDKLNQTQSSNRPLLALLESLLFVAAEPTEPAQLAKAVALPLAEIEQGLAQLAADYKAQGRGLRLQMLNGKVQLVTIPEAAPVIEVFLNLDNSAKLSGPALETLAVIAYRQPVTRTQIEAVRGVDCAAVLRSLAQRGLINEIGRQETIGRPILYGVTELFMQHFGLSELGELPPLEETEADRLWAATTLAEAEGDRARVAE